MRKCSSAVVLTLIFVPIEPPRSWQSSTEYTPFVENYCEVTGDRVDQ